MAGDRTANGPVFRTEEGTGGGGLGVQYAVNHSRAGSQEDTR